MEYEDKEFSALLLPDIRNLDDKEDALEKYPVLAKYPEFNIELKHFNRFLKYISFVYDGNSPLHTINSIPTRKSEAMMLAGFDKDLNGMFPEECEEAIRCTDNFIVKMIMRYIRIQKNATFAKRITYEESFYNHLEKLRTGLVDDEKSKDLISNTERLEDLINKTNSVLLNNDVNKNLTDAIINEIEEEELFIRPELVAKALKDGKDMKTYLGAK